MKEKKSLDINRSQPIQTNLDISEDNESEVNRLEKGFNNIHWLQISLTIILAIIALWSAYFVTQSLSSPKEDTKKVTQTDTSKDNQKDDSTSQIADKTAQAGTTTDTTTDTQTSNPFSKTSDTGTPAKTDNPETPASIAKDSFKVRILNGNGKAGDASRLKTDLVAKGFSVGTIGNARLKYDKTQIYYIVGQKDQADLVNQNLDNKQTEIQEAQSDLVGSGYQVLVVVGRS